MNKKALILAILLLTLCIPQASGEEAPEVRVLLSVNPSPLEMSCESSWKISWNSSSSFLDLAPQEKISAKVIKDSFWVILEQGSIQDCLQKVLDLTAFFQGIRKPLLGEAGGVVSLVTGPYGSEEETRTTLPAFLSAFPQVRIERFSTSLKMETSREYDFFWAGENDGKIIQFESSDFISVNQRKYRGLVALNIRVRENEKDLLLLNVLDLESYLYGVVPAEMPFEWPREALKAQAIACRTYALKKVTESSTSNQPYDIDATIYDQVYRGFDAEKESTNSAVDATRGEFLVFQGSLITAAFHSCSGGYTENNENVWKGSAVPYLRGVPSPGEEGSKYFTWTRTVTLAEMAKKVEEMKGLAIGQISSLEVIEKGVSGRIKTLQILGSTGTCTISGEELRKVANLPSSLTGWESASRGTIFALARSGLYEIPSGQTMALCASGLSPLPQTIHVLSSKELKTTELQEQFSEFLTFSGKGWGHGVGMPQWGAKARAEEGNAYREILTYYYQGVQLEKRY